MQLQSLSIAYGIFKKKIVGKLQAAFKSLNTTTDCATVSGHRSLVELSVAIASPSLCTAATSSALRRLAVSPGLLLLL